MWQDIKRRKTKEGRDFKKKVKVRDKKQKSVENKKEKVAKLTRRYMRMIKVCYSRYEEYL